MIYHDRMFKGQWVLDARLRALPVHVQLLLLLLRHLCDRYGRFEFNPRRIHLALYASANCRNVSARDVEGWLESLRAAGFIKSYTGADGLRVGEIVKEYWRQKLNYGQGYFEAPDSQEQLSLVADESPPPKNKTKKKGGGDTPSPHLTSPHFSEPASEPLAESDEQWLARVEDEWRGVDVRAELVKAHRKRKGDVERVWFETVWLPGVSPKAPLPSAQPSALSAQQPIEPEAWRLHLKDHHEGDSWAESAAATEWAKLPPQWRATITREMRAAGTWRAA